MTRKEALEIMEPVLRLYKREIETRLTSQGRYRFERQHKALTVLMEEEDNASLQGEHRPQGH